MTLRLRLRIKPKLEQIRKSVSHRNGRLRSAPHGREDKIMAQTAKTATAPKRAPRTLAGASPRQTIRPAPRSSRSYEAALRLMQEGKFEKAARPSTRCSPPAQAISPTASACTSTPALPACRARQDQLRQPRGALRLRRLPAQRRPLRGRPRAVPAHPQAERQGRLRLLRPRRARSA